MSFDFVPDEIVGKILCYLMKDQQSFINFALTSKRMKRISDQITSWPQWVRVRPVAFNLHRDLEAYSKIDCTQHGPCLDHFERTGCKCEISTRKMVGSKMNHQHTQSKSIQTGFIQYISGDDESLELSLTSNNCYYHRLYCMFNSKYINFSSLKFKGAYLFDRGCVRAIRDIIRFDKCLAQFKIRAFVELELTECNISLDWLNTVLNEFTNLCYLSLDQVSFTESSLLVDRKHYAAKKLKRLRIINDRTFKMTDAIFMFFIENLPAVELDLSGTRIEFNRRLIDRFYQNFSFSNVLSLSPSECIFTYPFVLSYLRRFQSVTRHLDVSGTNMSLISLKRIILDNDLKHLRITASNCPMLNNQEQTKFYEMVDEKDSARVRFE